MKPGKRSAAALLCLTITGPVPSGARSPSHYVAPTGSMGADGTRAHPWDLATALAGANGAVQPGDTVWLLGGTYRGTYRTDLGGGPGRYIVFRQLPGARATIDGTLRADGSYLAFWGFEILQSDPVGAGTYGLQANTNAGRFINLTIHDVGTQGVSFWTPGVDAELYGCIVYNNGSHANLDHGVYAHNEIGTKQLTDNVFFNNFARGIQIYASPKNAALNNFVVDGNVSFNNGTISGRVGRINLLISAQVPTAGMVATNNMLYFSPGTDGINIRLGNYAAANNHDVALRGNYAGGGRLGLEMVKPWNQATVEQNVFVGEGEMVRVGSAGNARYHWVGNRYYRDPGALAWRYGQRPTSFADWRQATGLGATDAALLNPPDTKVFIRPNKYESGRAMIVVYNWRGAATVSVDVASVLRAGDEFELRNVQAVFDAPLLSGTYRGDSIAIPMTGVTPPPPTGRPNARPPRTAPTFDVFLLTRRP
jgi:hypothetical protein